MNIMIEKYSCEVQSNLGHKMVKYDIAFTMEEDHRSYFKFISCPYEWVIMYMSIVSILTLNVQGPSYLGLTRSIS